MEIFLNINLTMLFIWVVMLALDMVFDISSPYSPNGIPIGYKNMYGFVGGSTFVLNMVGWLTYAIIAIIWI